MYLFTMLIALSFFTGCSDDDDTPKGSESWENLSGVYEGSKVNAKINGNTVLIAGKSVEVNASSANNALFMLNNVLPDSPLVEISVNLTETDSLYNFTGSTTVGHAAISVKGSFDLLGYLTMEIERTLSSPVTGDWQLSITTESDITSASVYAQVQTGSDMDMMINAIAGPAVGQLIAQRVTAVNVSLTEKGGFNVSWRQVNSTEDTVLPDYLLPLLNIQYVVRDNKLYMALDKNLVDMAGLFGGLLEEYGLNAETIVALFEDMGGYYAIPLNISTSGDITTFYLSKEVTAPLIGVLSPILLPLLPENMLPLLQPLLELLPTAEVLNIGLGFTK